MKYNIAILVILFIVSSCAYLPNESPLTIKGIIIKNTSSAHIKDVRLYVKKIRGFVSCDFIPAHSECSTTFPLRTYQGNPIQISWTQNNKSWSTGEYIIELPSALIHDKPGEVIVTVGEQGSIDTKILQ